MPNDKEQDWFMSQLQKQYGKSQPSGHRSEAAAQQRKITAQLRGHEDAHAVTPAEIQRRLAEQASAPHRDAEQVSGVESEPTSLTDAELQTLLLAREVALFQECCEVIRSQVVKIYLHHPNLEYFLNSYWSDDMLSQRLFVNDTFQQELAKNIFDSLDLFHARHPHSLRAPVVSVYNIRPDGFLEQNGMVYRPQKRKATTASAGL